MNYNQLQYVERKRIWLLLKEGNSLRTIANYMSRSVSTISREIKRNNLKDGTPEHADMMSKDRRMYSKLPTWFKYPEFNKFFKENYEYRYHGVERTWALAKQQGILSPSYKTLYNWINSGLWEIKRRDTLRKKYKGDHRRGVTQTIKRKFILPISLRSKKINNRNRIGDVEIDLVMGRTTTKYHLLTVVDRKTRYGRIYKVRTKGDWKIFKKMHEAAKDMKITSVTMDNGTEFNRMGLFAQQKKIKVYRCEPYSSFQRGTNENWNGYIRRTFPKKTDFTNITQKQLNDLADAINNMPRKNLGWISSSDLYTI